MSIFLVRFLDMQIFLKNKWSVYVNLTEALLVLVTNFEIFVGDFSSDGGYRRSIPHSEVFLAEG